MSLILLLFSLFPQLSGGRLAVRQFRDGHFLPDRGVTAGLIRPLTTAQICRIKWGKDERHVTPKMKRAVCTAYGETASKCPGPGFEIDHLVSRELGGADDVKNLWPEPEPDAHVKDVVENRLHRDVCAGKISLKDAQETLRTDWTKGIR